MLVSFFTHPELTLITRTHEPPLREIHKRLLRRLLVLQVPQHHARRLHAQLPRLVVARDLVALGVDQFRFIPGNQGPGAAKPDVAGISRRDDGAGLGEAVALADPPGWVLLRKFLGGFLAERGGAGEDHFHRLQVEFVEDGLVLDHGDDDGRHDVERVDLVFRDGLEIVGEVELGQDDDLVAAVGRGVADDDKAVDVGLREEAEGDVLVVSADLVAERFVVGGDLHCVGDHVAVGDHHAFLVGD